MSPVTSRCWLPPVPRGPAKVNDRFTRAGELGIHIGDLTAKRDSTNSAIEETFGARMAAGGRHVLNDGEADLLRSLYSDMAGIWSDLDRTFTNYDFYTEHRACFDAWEGTKSIRCRPR